jgi:uncharacterized membrane protein YcaP (DUF421 family)
MTQSYLYFLSLLAARTFIILVAMVVGFRLLGKRQLGQLNVYDLALVMALANAVQNAMTSGAGDLTVGIVTAGTLLVAGKAMTSLFIRLPRFERMCVGMPTIIIQDGEFVRSHMRREAITIDQVLAVLRQNGIMHPHDVALAVLEVDGSISVVPKGGAGSGQEQPRQPSDSPPEVSRSEAGAEHSPHPLSGNEERREGDGDDA